MVFWCPLMLVQIVVFCVKHHVSGVRMVEHLAYLRQVSTNSHYELGALKSNRKTVFLPSRARADRNPHTHTPGGTGEPGVPRGAADRTDDP
jgi:hypothetical protein